MRSPYLSLRSVRRAWPTGVSTIVLVSLQVVNAFGQLQSAPPSPAPVLTTAAAQGGEPLAIQSALSTDSSRIVPNRALPRVTPPQLGVAFSATPSPSDISSARILPESLHPVTEPSAGQTRAVARALEAFAAAGDRGAALDALEQFARAGDNGAWQASLLANVGTLRSQAGYFTRAAALWDTAWESARFGDSPDAHLVADYAVGQRLLQAVTFGQVDVLQQRLADLEARPVRGVAGHAASTAREALGVLVYHHEQAVFSGPEALKGWLAASGRFLPAAQRLVGEYRPPHEGTSLVALANLASRAGTRMAMRYVTDLATLPAPSIVHFKSNHYSLLVGREPGGYRLRDVALGGDLYMTAAAMQDEFSGYALVEETAGADDIGRGVPVAEGERVFGHCFPGGPVDDDPCNCWADGNPPPSEAPGGDGPGDDSSGGNGSGGPPPDDGGGNPPPSGPGSSCGMPVYAIHPMSASILLSDVPVRYDPPRGPSVEFRLRYNQRATSGGGTGVGYGNVGAGWRHDWLAYVVDNNSSAVAPFTWTDVFERGEGSEEYNAFTGNMHWRTRATLTQVASNPPLYTRTLPDGTIETYAFPDRGPTAPNRKIFLTEVKNPRGQTLTFTYDASIRLVAVTDAIGQVTTLSYQSPVSSTLLTKVTDPFGRTATMTYDGVGQLTSITDAIGMQSRFAYDDAGFLNAMTTPYGTTQFRNEDVAGASAHRAVSVVDPEGGTERMEYWATSAVGLPSAVPLGEVPAGFTDLNQSLDLFNSLYWNKQAMAEAPNDRARATVTRWLVHNEGGYAPHAGGRAIAHSVKRPLENRVWYRYPGQPNANTIDSIPHPSQIAQMLADGSTQLQQYTYNTNGFVTSTSDPVGRQTTLAYAANNIDVLQISQTRPGGSDVLLTKSGFSSLHQPTTVTDAAGQATTYTYNAAGQMLTATNPKNETTTYTYAPTTGYLQSVTRPASGATVSISYDGYGRPQTTTGVDGYAVTLTYDALNRPTRTTYPDGTYDGLTYDKLDVAERVDRLGRVTRYFYDRVRRLTAVRDALGRTIRQEWCGCGSLLALVDANGHRTSWTRDARGRVTLETRADGTTTTSYAYDATGRLLTVTDTKGQIATHSYTMDDRLNGTTYSNAVIATPGVTYGYDPVYPRVATMTDGVGTTTYTYQPVGALGALQVATVDGPFANDLLGYTYDQLGRVTNRTVNGAANSATWAYDGLGRLTSELNVLGTFGYTYVGATTRLATASYPNGQATTFAYLPNLQDRRLQTIRHIYPNQATLSQFDYTYDAVGNIRGWRQQADSTATQWSYDYDAADQLTQAVQQSADTPPVLLKRYAYGYDPAGNRTREQIDDAVTTATHDALNRLQAHAPGGLLTFAGTLSEPGRVTVQGQPLPLDGTNSFRGWAPVSSGTNVVAVSATDASGNSVTKQYQVNGAGGSATFTSDLNSNLTSDGTRTFEWDAKNRLVAITSGTVRSEFIYDGQDRRVRIVEKSDGVVSRDAIAIWDDAEIIEERVSTGIVNRFFGDGEQDGGQPRFVTRDHLGSVRETTDSFAAVTSRNAYDPYGRLTRVGGGEDSHFGFTGLYIHQASSLVFARYRVYSPSIGRWLSEDPIRFMGGTNWFSYVQSNTTSRWDPSGLDWYRQPGQDYVVGRPDTFVPEGGWISRIIENHVPAGRTFGEIHDALVDERTKAGFPDWLTNVETMPYAYAQAVLKETERSAKKLVRKALDQIQTVPDRPMSQPGGNGPSCSAN